MAMPATIGLATIRVNSSGVKFALPAMSSSWMSAQSPETSDGSFGCLGRIYFHGLGKDCLQGVFQKAIVRSILPRLKFGSQPA